MLGSTIFFVIGMLLIGTVTAVSVLHARRPLLGGRATQAPALPEGAPRTPKRLIQQLLDALKIGYSATHPSCTNCSSFATNFDNILGQECTAYVVCGNCLQGSRHQKGTLLSCKPFLDILQEAVDEVRAAKASYLQKELKSLEQLEQTLEDKDCRIYFPDEHARIQERVSNQGQKIEAIRASMEKFPPDLVRTLAERLAEDWRREQRGPLPEQPSAGPYRTLNSDNTAPDKAFTA